MTFWGFEFQRHSHQVVHRCPHRTIKSPYVEESETSLEEIFVSAWLARSSRIRGCIIWIRVRVEGIRVDKGETLSG